MIYRLFYTSRCIIRDNYNAKNEAELIASKAAINNKQINITGAITFDGNDFAQILEGEESDVLKLFEKIKQDPRHKNITLIKVKQTKTRYYKNWGMRSLNSSNYDELVQVMSD
jgi:hypothetical protein